MPGLFSRLKGKDSKSKKKNAGNDLPTFSKPTWDDAWTRKSVDPEEIHELLHFCTEELKARGLDLPFLLLPFRPTSDPSAVRSFIRHFFDQTRSISGETLLQEVRMTEPMVLSGVAKWCWSRLQGGVVGWDAYELFKVGEFDSNMARNSFRTFIPLSVDNGARQRIIFDFFDLMAALAAHGKSNGLGGRKLSRMAAWWVFEQKDTGNGFEGGYNAWLSAADATSHLFFAFLRTLAPEQNLGGISMLPMSLQKLVQETEYPPQKPELMMTRTNKVVMIVDTVSPTPFALLRRANHFQYRDSDRGLQEFSEYEDPVQALSEECKRVLKAVSSANQSQVSSSKHSTSLRDASWSRFEDIGFTSALEDDEEEEESALSRKKPQGLRSTPASGNGLGRPTTPSWADFLSSGFVDDDQARSGLLLPPDQVLPPIETQSRQRSSQSHRPRLESDQDLDPGELASITFFDLDDAFWWVWMSSLAPEETPERKSAFGRCAIIETKIKSGRWLVMEEMIAGAAPEPHDGAYIAEKKGFFSWTRRGRTLGRSRSTGKQALDRGDRGLNGALTSKTSIGPDTHAKIQAKAAQLRAADEKRQAQATQRSGHMDYDLRADKTTSVMTMQSNLVGEASSAMKWVKKYDKGTIKDAYLANTAAGRGSTLSPVPTETTIDGTSDGANGHAEGNGFAKAPEQPPQVPTKEARGEEAPKPEVQKEIQKKEIQKKEVPKQETPKKESPKKELHKREVLRKQIPSSPVAAPAAAPATTRISQRKPIGSAPAPLAAAAPPPPVQKDEEPKTDPAAPADPETHDAAQTQVKPDPTPAPVPAPTTAPAPAPAPAPLAKDEPLVPAQAPEAQPPAPVAPAAEPTKKEQKKSSGFKKLFTRKNRASKLPENASKNLNTMLQQGQNASGTNVAQTPTPAATPTPDTPKDQSKPAAATDGTTGPEASGRKEAASVGETLSRIDTQDAAEAKREFSRFDQGPLSDQPAFIPNDSDDEDDATPPPIARHPPARSTSSLKSSHEPPKEEHLSQSAGPGVQDRWAQIRKNAAERAAQYERNIEDQNKFRHSRATDNDDDTSGEETIESRVARIKARVAELTGSMEGVSGPQSPQTPQQSSPAAQQ